MRFAALSVGTLLTLGVLLAAAACGGGGIAGAGGAGTGGGSGDPTCDVCCAGIMANCTAGNQQYSTKENCMNSCKAIPVGKASDTAGNTLGCRIYHAGAAKMDAALHCPHAGPGGDGTCGAVCDGYCQIAMMYCTAANMAAIYADDAACQADCAAHKSDTRYNTGVDHGDQQACLLDHVQEASTTPYGACTGDLAPIMSGTCKDHPAGP